MATESIVPAFGAFEDQLKTLCLKEFPCGLGSWTENLTHKTPKKKLPDVSPDKVSRKFTVTLKDYGSHHIKTESLEELLSSKRSPWNQDYSWSEEAKALREIAVKSPWLIDQKFVLAHFKTLRIIDKGVSEIDANLLNFPNLEELTLTANKLCTIQSENLPQSLQVLEVCANQISELAALCVRPPPLIHLGLGHNLLTVLDDYITGEFWPCLLSLDLVHNNLCDLMDIVRKLQTLPKLRNIVLQGNPLSLIPGYRGFVIDSLRNLDFLDDVPISADEKHHYKGLARRKEYILDEAKIHLHVDYIKGVLKPEELKNPEDLPEYPIITRNYYIQFNFLEDKSANAEIFCLMDDDGATLTDRQTEDGQSTARESIIPPPSEAAKLSSSSQALQGPDSHDNQSQLAGSRLSGNMAPTEGSNTHRTQSVVPESEAILGLPTDSHTKSGNSLGSEAMTPGPVLRLAPIRSASATWQEEMELNWHSKQTRDDLLSLRDFLLQGMDITVMEEKILSYPADQVQDGVLTPVKDKGKGDKKKDDKKKEEPHKKGKKQSTPIPKKTPPPKKQEEPKKKKKKGEPEVELHHMPAEYTELASFHVPLADFLEGEYSFENVYTKSWQAESGTTSAMSNVTTQSKPDKKDKKKDKHAKDNKKSPRPDRKSPKPDRKSPKLDPKHGAKDKGEKNKSKTAAPDTEDEPAPPPPPLEVHVKVRLHHWRTAVDSLREEQEDAEQAAQAQQQAGK